MNRLKTIIVLTLPFLFLGMIPLSLDRAWPPAPFYLGTRINCWDDEVTISSSDYSCVWHGWDTWPTPWSEMSGEERAHFMGPGLWFELETDLPWQHPLEYQTYYVIAWEIMGRLWGIQFKPGDLTPGVYTFTGRWYYDYELAIESTVIVTVTP